MRSARAWTKATSWLVTPFLVLSSGWAAPGAQMRTPEEQAPPDPALSSLPDDVRMGLEVATMLAEAIGLHENEEWQRRLSRVGYRVASVAGGRDLPYNFQILDLPEPNAMALPGGFLFITRGMMESEITDDELAHLIGHEISHVHREHFERGSRLDTLFSLLQTALMIGILIGVPEGGSQRVAVSEDPGDRTWAVGMTGKAALLQGASFVGSVARALFERGYSRKLEFEADETGFRLAVAAGYPPAGGVALLQRLRERSFEGNRFSYWRTHPYFEDRLARARAREAQARAVRTYPDDNAFRQRIALFFATTAEKVRDERQAIYLYRCALQSEPRQFASLPAGLGMVHFKRVREERKHMLERKYGPLIADYDTLIVQALRVEPAWNGLSGAREERRELDWERRKLETEYLQRIDAHEASTDLLERFLVNYPNHDRLAEMTFLLGLHYQLSGRADDAVEVLEAFLKPPLAQTPVWADSSVTVMLAAVDEIEDLVLCQEVHDLATDPSLERLVEGTRRRMNQLVAGRVTLQEGGRYLQTYPDSPWSEELRRKVWTEARRMYGEARVNEGLHRYQEALNACFAILALAPGSPAAEEADASIERIHRMEHFQ